MISRNRNVSQNIKASIRRDLQKQLANAVKMRVERGTVSTERGDWMKFTVRYSGDLAFICIAGLRFGTTSIQMATSAALYEWGYTR